MSGNISLSYRDRVNPDLLRLIPPDARRVLEFGCGTGALAAAYRQRNRIANYIGVEIHRDAAEAAKKHIDRVVIADAETVTPDDLGIVPGTVDCLVYGDVLEHLREPWSALRRHAEWLHPNGQAIACIPNIQHYSAILRLLHGIWEYQDEGLFDRTHLRFFTLKSMTELFVQAGLHAFSALPRRLAGDGFDPFTRKLMPLLESLGIDPAMFVERSAAIQYVIRGVRASASPKQVYLHTQIGAELACGPIRVHQPNEFLRTIPGVHVSVAQNKASLGVPREGEARVVIFQRCILKHPQDLAQLRRLIDAGYLVVAEIDDDPSANRSSEFVKEQYLSFRGCHCVQTSTDELARFIRPLNPNVAVFPNQIPTLPPYERRPADSKLELFFGAFNREDDWRPLIGPLNEILSKYREQVRVRVVHDRLFHDQLEHDNKEFTPTCDYETYLDVLASCDVAILPLGDNQTNRMKSDLKFIQCAAAGVVVLASPVVYGNSVVDGVTGMLFSDPAEFVLKFEQLIADRELRDRLARNAWAYVDEHRMLGRHFRERYDWYRRMFDELPRLTAEIRARVPEIFSSAE